MKLAYSFIVLLLCILLSACSSVDSDAKKAAALNRESMEYIQEGDLSEAERAYKESQEIVSRYKGTEKYEEFYAAYNSYMFGEVSGN